MLPQFPIFKKLELSDKADIDAITCKYPPYSDFNFVSMWSWNVESEMRVCQLNGNLVVNFTDYITAEPFLSFLGSNRINETVEDLLTLSHATGMQEQLKLVPELSIQGLDLTKFVVQEDRDHFDYILSLEKLADYEAGQLAGHASFNRRFLEQNGSSITLKTLDLGDSSHRQEITSLTTIWMQNKVEQNKSFLSHLEDAVKRYLYIAENKYHDSFVSVGVFHKDKLVAFTINELVDPDYSICHFMKGDNSLKGIYSHLVTKTAQEILKTGRKYINFEQDLGLKNLRQSKKTFKPVSFLKKYTLNKLWDIWLLCYNVDKENSWNKIS